MKTNAIFLLFAIHCLVVLVGCQRNTTWQEEVALNTGEIIRIEREVKHAGGGAAWPQGQGSIPREHVIRFSHPSQGGAVIQWRSTKLTQSTYAELPLVLAMNPDKSWTIYTVLVLGPVCDQYLKYQFKDGVWKEIPLQDDIETYRTNLYIAAGSAGIEGVIRIAEKNEEHLAIGFRARLKKVGPKRFACNSNYEGPYPPAGAV